jgi:CheY-like chemotaxis protein/anti-sigma regulatory factor (Ser/Thr protein kinase)
MVKADRSQLHQVLLNLCVNARDAMPKGGTITLESTTITGAELSEQFTGVKAKHYACIRVIDTGTGISKQVKPHIFEPFYTTKERSKGTGLGLSVVYGVVDNPRGFVHVDSEPGYGTTFSVYLPLEHAADPATSARPDATVRPNERGRTIMLVEDEEMLRGLGVLMLEGDGYRVLAAKDGAEAVEMFTEHMDEIGLVICDLGLPKLGGREVFLRMKELKPNVRAIVASGYLEPHVRSEILKAGVIDTVQKPYEFREMLVKIRAIIGQPNPEDDQPQLF